MNKNLQKYVKKSLTSSILFFLLLSQFQIGVLYSSYSGDLENQKTQSTQILEKVGEKIDKTVDILETRVHDKEIQQQLADKQEEIKEYLEEVQTEISEETSKTDIKKLTQEAHKTVVLKVVSGVTKYDDVEDHLPEEITKDKARVEEALEVIQDSLETDGEYSIIVQSKYDQKKVTGLFAKFDKSTQVELMYENEGIYNYEIFISPDSFFAKEMMEDIQSGILPESFLGIKIVQPEVFSLFSEELGTAGLLSLQGEDLTKTWGIEHYQTKNYLGKIKSHMSTEGLSPLRIGIIDTGIDYNHPDLKGRVTGGHDFVNKDTDAMDDQGHGTHVSGTIGASINGSGIIGVNPYVEFVPIKICTKRGFCPSYAVIKALEYTKNEKIDILNMSLGGRGNPTGHAICQGIKANTDSGVIVISASGNSNINTSQFVPGGCETAITVAAVDSNMKRAPFSNYGQKVDVSAPGVKVYSTLPNNRYRALSGTSMATPHIVGVVSLIKTFKSDLNQEEARQLLKKFPLDVSTLGSKPIAKAVDVMALADYLTKPKEEEKEEVAEETKEVIEIVKEEEKEDAVEEKEDAVEEKVEEEKDDATVNPNLESTQSTSTGTGISETEETFGLPALPKLTFELDIEEMREGVEINSTEEIDLTKVEVESISIEEESVKEYETIDEVQHFTSTGALLSKDSVEINSVSGSGSEGNWVTNTGALFEGDTPPSFGLEINEETTDFSHIEKAILERDGTDGGVEINSVGEEENSEEEIQEYYIDGAEKPSSNFSQGEKDNKEGVNINSLEEEKPEEVQLLEYQSGALDAAGGDMLGDALPEGVSEEDALEIHEDDILAEPLEEIHHTEELLIDGAEKGVEINSVGEEDEGEELLLLEDDEILQDSGSGEILIIGEDGATSTETIDVLEEGIAEETVETEILEEIEVDTEVLADGATRPEGVEINSLGDEEPSEEDRMEIPEFSEELIAQETSTGVVIGEDTEVELTDEEIKALEEEYGVLEEGEGGKEGEEVITKLEAFDETLLQQSLDAESNGGVEINSLGDEYEEELNIEITPEQEEEFKKMWGEKDENEEILPDLKEFDESEKFGEEQPTEKGGEGEDGVQINSYGFYGTPSIGTSTTVGTKIHHNLQRANYYKYSLSDPSLANIRASRGGFHLDTKKAGVLTVRVYDSNWRPSFTFYLHIRAIPVVTESILQGEAYVKYIRRGNSYSYAFSDRSLGTLRTRRGGFTIYNTNKPGTLYVTINNSWGGSPYILKLIIKPKPKPKVYTINVTQGQYVNFRFPTKKSYKFYHSGGNGGRASVWSYDKYARIRGDNYGNTQFHVYSTHHLYTLNINVIPKVKVIKNQTLFVGTHNYYGGNRDLQLSTSKSGMVSFYRYRRSFRVTGKKPGRVNIYVKHRGVHIQRIELTVKPRPKPKTYNVTLVESKQTYLYLPTQRGQQYRFSQKTSNGGWVGAWQYGNKVKIRASQRGNSELRVYDRKNGIHYYTINIKIAPKPPEVVTKELYEGRWLWISYPESRGSSFYSGNIRGATIRNYAHGFRIYSRTARDLQLYWRDSKGIHRYTYKIKFKPIPQPKVYNYTVSPGNYTNIYFPGNTYQYRVHTSGSTNILTNFHRYSNRFGIKTKDVGTFIIYFRDNRTGFYTHKIYVTSKIQEKTFYMNQKDTIEIPYSRGQSIVKSSHGIHTFYQKSRGYVTAYRTGTYTVKIYDNAYLKRIHKIIVRPIPKIITLNCNTQTTLRCRYFLPNNGYRYSESRANVFDLDARKGSNGHIDIKGNKSGTGKIYVYSHTGGYYTHVINVKITPRPPKIYYVTSPVGVEVLFSKWSATYDRTHKFGVSKSGILDFFFHKYNSVSRLQFTGKKTGNTDVYIYKDNDVIAVVKATIIARQPPITSSKTGYVKLIEGQSLELTLSGGGGTFTAVSTNKDAIGETLKGNTLKIFGRKTGRGYVRVTDQYNQTLDIKVVIEESVISVGKVDNTMDIGQHQQVEVYNFYKGITVEKNNQNVSVTIKDVDPLQKSLIIKAKSSSSNGGKVVIGVKDLKGNVVSFTITVSGQVVEKEEEKVEKEVVNNSDTGNVRYIRDWANGSNRNSGSHWIEIQALDTEGKNIAKGKTVMGGGSDIYGKAQAGKNRPFSRVTDESTNVYSRTWSSQKYLMVDLGKTYNIEKVKVWHYYPDGGSGRVYKKTKTEVSVDGKNWTVLFDSAKEGTYVEPKDGSGRSYEVGENKDEELIKEIIFTDLVNSKEIGGIAFKTTRRPDRIGILYQNELGEIVDKKISVQKDGKYILAFLQTESKKQDTFKIYYVIGGKKYYYSENLVASYGSSIGVANDGVNINNQGYIDFQNILKYIWYTKGYEESYVEVQEKIYDIKEEVQGESINIILQTIAKTAGIKLENEYINIETLPVAGYMLDKFLNGPSEDEFYDTNYWISQKFKESDDYKNILALIQSKNYQYKDLEEGEERTFLEIGKSSSSFDFSWASQNNFDLYMAVHSYNYGLSIYKHEGVFYTKIQFEDEYDFGEGKYGLSSGTLSQILTDNLNFLGTYHEEYLGGTPYNWRVEIIDKLK